MIGETRVISVDDHVQEPPDLWTERLPGCQWGDRLPHVAPQRDGSERWVIGGRVQHDMPLAETGALSASRFGPGPRTWADVPAAAYDPQARLGVMDEDGIDMSILYPTVGGRGGERFAAMTELDLQVACAQAYNDWLLDTWAAASPRFVPQCLVPVLSVEAATAELERAVGLGHKGVIVPIQPSQVNDAAPNLYSPEWDPFWSAAVALDVPVCFHSGSTPITLLNLYPGADAAVIAAFNAVRPQIASSGVVPKFLFSGIPERCPALKAVFANSGVGWGSYALEVSDHEWDRKFRQVSPVERKPPPYDMELPADMFHRQCYIAASFESVGMKVRDFIGVGNILWQSEFPMAVSTYPSSRETIERNFAGVPAEERERILWRTAAKLYNIRVEALA